MMPLSDLDTRIADDMDMDSIFEPGNMYYDGGWYRSGPSACVGVLREGSGIGHHIATNDIGYMYEEGGSVKSDEKEAEKRCAKYREWKEYDELYPF